MIGMNEEGQQEQEGRHCIIPGCNNPFPKRPGAYKICDSCRENFKTYMGQMGYSVNKESIDKQQSHWIKSGLSLQDFLDSKKHKKRLTIDQQGNDEKKQEINNAECPLIKGCSLSQIASEDDDQCHGGKHEGCSSFKRQMKDKITENHEVGIKKHKGEKIVLKPQEDDFSDVQPEAYGIPDDSTNVKVKEPVVAAVENKPGVVVVDDIVENDDHLIDAIIAPIMTGLKNANTLLVRKGILPRPTKNDKETVINETNKILGEFKEEIKAMFEDFKANTRRLIEIEVKTMAKDYKATQAVINESVAMEVARRFRFMTSTYEDHLKALEAEDKEKKRKELLKDMRES